MQLQALETPPSEMGLTSEAKHASRISDYFDHTSIYYDLFWVNSALHIGWWESDTRNLAEAVRNTDRFIASCLDINGKDRVLDAGCGIGGTSIFLAEETGAELVGITLSSVQVESARKKAGKSSARDRLSFVQGNFKATKFESESFSKIFALESLIHNPDKARFLAEARRLLKPDGKLAVIDAFLLRNDFNPTEQKVYEAVLQGFACDHIAVLDDFRRDLERTGFDNVVFHDKLPQVRRTSRVVRSRGMVLYPILKLLSLLRVCDEDCPQSCVGSINQWKMFYEHSMATYGVFVAEKK